MFNQITLVGNLTRDIELRYAQSGKAIAKTAIATSHKYTSNGEKKEETCFVDITAFGKTGEIMNQYLRKGSKVLIVGRLKLEQWEKDGQKRSKHSVIVETMKMLDSKSDNTGNANNNYQQPQQQSYQQSSSQPQQNDNNQQQSYQQPQHGGYGNPNNPPQQQTQQSERQQVPFIDIDEDEIPF